MAGVNSAPTLRELLLLPERVNPSDFVLRLSEGVANPEETLKEYVVTPQLVQCFDRALGLIQTALETNTSRATYLHGSFGAGKSHFMAVLYLLLSGNLKARGIAELAPVVERHNRWTQGKLFLLVPYHMVGAESVEERMLGGYVDHLRKLHPERPPAGLYRSDTLLENARELRAQMGDDLFFAALNRIRRDEWGALGSAWTADSFERACRAHPLDEERVRLVGDLAATLLSSARQTAGFVSLDDGLAIMSAHARSLGYSALILFLDELILWLATKSADVAFVTREAPKLVKLVEAGTGSRPLPIVSFVARQRDLRSVVGEHALGAEVKNFEDALAYFEARFDKITLEDRNLPAITGKRVLRPRSETARQLMDQAFEATMRIRDSVREILLTNEGDRQEFRQVYPFTPALVKTLVGVSSALQRERTALKIMMQLLVSQQDTLRLGDLVPVGDLFGAMQEGHDPFSRQMQEHFEKARKLWEHKLKPIIEQSAGVRYEDLGELPADDPRVRRLKADERLVGTLVLSALVPEVETLRGLTPRRLAALNHGSIKLPIPGGEPNEVLNRVRDWASKVGEVKISGDGVDSVVSVQITGVDTSLIVANAGHEDNTGNRIQMLKRLLFEELGMEYQSALILEHKLTWRATARFAELRFANVWEAGDATLRSAGDMWRVVIDFPFDRDHHTPQDDLVRLAQYRQNTTEPSRTLIWLPSFFSLATQSELGRLVVLEFLLSSEERLKQYSSHLSAADRAEARNLLTNQRDQLRERLKRALRQAYGAQNAEPGVLDPAHELEKIQQFQSLDTGLKLRPPVAADLRGALKELLEQALAYQYPAHPDFREDEVRITDALVRRAFDALREAIGTPDQRLTIDRETRRQFRPLLEPLMLAHVGEQFLVVERHWLDHFDRREAERGGGAITVGQLRKWIDEPKPMGLPANLQNLIILTYALQTDRLLTLHGAPFEGTVTNLRDDIVLEQQEVPAQEMWDTVVHRAGQIFGVTISPLPTLANLQRLDADVRDVVRRCREPLSSYVAKLRPVLQRLNTEGEPPARLRTAEAVQTLIAEVEQTRKSLELARRIQTAAVVTSETAMGVALKQAGGIHAALDRLNLALFESLARIEDEPRATVARGILRQLREALREDEHVTSLDDVVRKLEEQATRLILDVPRPPIPLPPPIGEEVPLPPPKPGKLVVASGRKAAKGLAGWKEVAREIESNMADDTELVISWEILREQTQ
ncbi:MAG: phage resistance protein [Acidobacteriota bacterium]